MSTKQDLVEKSGKIYFLFDALDGHSFLYFGLTVAEGMHDATGVLGGY